MSSPALPASTSRAQLSAWIREIRGGLNGALVALPTSMSYGLAAFAPLGLAYAGAGMMAALLAAIVTPLVCALAGMRNLQVFTARSVSSVVLAAFLAEFIATQHGLPPPLLVAQAVLLFVATVGLLELFFSAARVGSLAKYLPGPVMTGFSCGVAVVLIKSQLKNFLGLDHVPHWNDLARVAAEFRPLAPLITIIVIIVATQVARRVPRAPAYLIAILAGTLAHGLLSVAGAGPWLGTQVGHLDMSLPDFAALRHMADPASMAVLLPLLPVMFGWAFTAAVIATTDSLITHKFIEELTERKIDSNRELMRGGVANLIGAACGAIHVGVSIPSTLGTFTQGGRDVRASIFVGVGIFLCAVILAPLVSLVPNAAIAGLLWIIAWRMFDPWTLQLGKRVLTGKQATDREVLGMLATVLVVAGLALFWNFLVAVGVGLAIAVASFIWRMSRSIIRRRYTGRDLQSRNLRAPAVRELLQEHGRRIVVFELEGPLFFGTGEKLIAELEALAGQHICAVVIDMKRLNDIDATGARLLAKIAGKLARQRTAILVSGIAADGRIAQVLTNFGLQPDARGKGVGHFHDIDAALEWAEDMLLEELGLDLRQQDGPVALGELDMLRGFSDAEIDHMRQTLSQVRIAAGANVFVAGDAGNALYAIVAGRASVVLTINGGPVRLGSFSAGSFFGEIALLDRKPRSATVRADTDLVCYVLDETSFARLQAEQPACAIKLLTNLGRELSTRLRNNNTTIQTLGN